MDFFIGKEARDFFVPFHDGLKKEIAKMTDEEITSCDFQEWIDYLVSKYSIASINLFETNIQQSLSETKVKKSNPFRGHPFEPDYYEHDGVCITFTIPFDGNPDLFEMRPSSYILSRFPASSFTKPRGMDCGSFNLEFCYTKQHLQNEGDNMATFVQQQFQSVFASYRTMVGNVNAEVDSYNGRLASMARQLLEVRKEKASSFAAISNALQIPLTKSKNAPNTNPIPLQRIIRQPASKPSMKPVIPESYISDGDYDNINNIILTCGTTMEKTARTYYSNNEEELRDHLLAALNTHYEDATGETFRKIGKTDIHIEFENKAAYIGECKIWHGEKLFQDAIQQVISYSTWRDIKVSVIIFNKENQSFPAILSKIKTWADGNVKSYIQPQANVWNCKYYRSDMNVDIQLTILAFDLYVDKNQFKDMRY